MNQDLAYDPGYGAANATIGLFGWLIILAVWCYMGYCMLKMAQKCGHGDSGWWGFVPILNTFLLIKMAQKPMWWFVLCLVPVVNIIAFFALWIATAKNCGASAIWGVLALIPLLNFVAWGVMAFGSPSYQRPTPPQSAPQQHERIGV